ncbi:MAG: hypothetical protein PHV59_01790 [Victivallales bacterium]|nr:hypothetical protein [Victivallales bacterium]
MKLRKGFLLAVLAVVAGAGYGAVVRNTDKQDDGKLFDQVSSRLDRNGSYFYVQNNKYLFRAVENTYLQIPAAIRAIISDPQQQIMPLMIYNCLKPLVQNLGINEILAWGASSVLIIEKTDKHPALFRSRQFIYYGDQPPKGLLWDFVAGENADLTELSSLPKETLLASASQVVPGKIWDKVKFIFTQLPLFPVQNALILAEQQFFDRFQVKLPDLLASLSGTWSSVLISAKTADGKPAVFAMLKIPNKNNLVFQVLAEMVKSRPSLKISPDEISYDVPFQLAWFKPAVRRDDNNVYIVSNAEILEMVKAAAGPDGLMATPEFKYLRQGLPERGVAFFYFSRKTFDVAINLIKAHIPDAGKDWSPLTALLPPTDLFMVASREKDGIMYVANSPMDIPQLITYSSLMPTIVQLAAVIPALNKARTKAQQLSGMNNLKRIGLALKMYAMDHKDRYPEENNVAGLNKLIRENYLTDLAAYVGPNSKAVRADGKELQEQNSSYVYLGGFVEGDGTAIPLVFDKPGEDKKMLNVFFQDGRVASVPGKFRNCTELIAQLAKTSSFKPEILKKLQERARQADNELGYK